MLSDCKVCKALFVDLSYHKCPPLWNVWCSDHHGVEEPGHEVRGFDAQAAAQNWADETDCDGEYTIVSGSPATVRVTLIEEPEDVTWFEVTGESQPVYYASEIQAPK